MSITRNIGMILLAVFLILLGISYLVVGFAVPPAVLGVLAIAAAVFILIGR
jgi:hypothetical protein